MEKKQKGTPLMIMLYNVCVFCPAYVTRSTGPAPYTVCDAALYGAQDNPFILFHQPAQIIRCAYDVTLAEEHPV